MAFCSLNSIQSLSHIGSGSSPAITTSTTITNSYVSSKSWPLVITGGTSSVPIVITIGENINLTSSNNFFILYTDYVTFEGSNNTITFSNVSNYNGFIKNGSVNSDGFNNIYVQNLTIYATNTSASPNAYTNSYAGWFGQAYFGKNATNNVFNNCVFINNANVAIANVISGISVPYGSASTYGGGISGAYTNASAVNCAYFSQLVQGYGGGIFGAYSTARLNNCYTCAATWSGLAFYTNAGGLVGAYSTVDISSCFVTGINNNGGYSYLGQNSGTFVGSYTSGKVYNAYANSGGYSLNFGGPNSTVVYTSCYNYNSNWLDSLSNSILYGVNSGIWTDVNLSATNNPYVLTSFNTPIYYPSYPVPTLLPPISYIDITTISGLKLWLDASSSSSFTNSGGTGAVTGTVTWRDKSGLGNDMVSGNSSNGAYLTTFTSKPAVFFPRSINILTTPNINVQIFPMTYFVVICANASSGDDFSNIFSSNFYDANGNQTGSYNGLHIFCDATSGIGVSKIGGGNSLSSGLPNVGQSLYIFTIQLNTSGSTTSSTVTNLQIKTNGTTVINQAFSNTYLTNYGPTIQPRRGSLYISEMIYYQSLLSGSDIAKVEAYLANKWGISINQSYPYFPYQISYNNNFIVTSLPFNTPIGSSKYNNFTLVRINDDLPTNYPNISFNTTYGTITFDTNTYDASYTILIYAQNTTYGYNNYSINTFVSDISAGNSKNVITTSTNITQSWVNSHIWPCYIQGGTSSSPVVIHITESITFTNKAQYFVIQGNYITVDGCNNTLDGSYNAIYISNITNYFGVFQNGAYTKNQTISAGYSNITIQNLIVDNSNNSSSIPNYAGWLGQQYFGNNATNNNLNLCFNSDGNVPQYGGGLVGANSKINVNACGFSSYIITNEGGGICGKNAICKIQNSYANVFSYLAPSSGGLCGSYSAIDASNCYVIGSTQGQAGAFTGIYCSGSIYNSYSIGSIYGFVGVGSTVSVKNSYNSSSNNNWYSATALNIINNVEDAINVEDPVTWLDLTTQYGFSIPFALSVFIDELYSVNDITINSVPFNTVAASNAYNSFTIVSIGLNGSSYGSVSSLFPFITVNSTTGVITFDKNTYTGYYSILIYAYNTQFYTYSVNTFNCTVTTKNQPIIRNSISINQDYVNNNLWPALVQTSSGYEIVITITENLVLTDPLNYFMIGCNNVIIDGQNYIIDVSGISYPGLVQNGTVSKAAFNFITIRNILIRGINSSASGWFGQNYYGTGGNNNVIENCYIMYGVFIGDYGNIKFNKCGVLGGNGSGFLGSNATTTITNSFINGNQQNGFIIGTGGGAKTIIQSYIISNIAGNWQGGPYAPPWVGATINNSYFYGTNQQASGQTYQYYFYNQTNVYSIAQSASGFNIGDAFNTLLGANGTIWNSFKNPFILATFNNKIYYDSSNNTNITSLPYSSSKAIITNVYTNYSILSVNNMAASSFPNITIDNSGVITFSNTTYDSIYYVNVYQSDAYGRYNSNYFITTITTGILPSNAIMSTTYINQVYVNNASWPIPIEGGTLINPINIYLSEDITLSNVKQYFMIDCSYVTFNGNNQKIIIQNINGYPGLFQNGYVIETPTGTNYINGYSNVTIQNAIIYNNGSSLLGYNGWFGQKYYGYNASNNIFNNCFNSLGDIAAYSGGIVGAYSYCDISVCAVYTNNLNSYGGGIVGPYSNVNIYNCYVSINSNIYSYAGGISAPNNTIQILNSYVIGNFTTNTNVGAICGSDCSGLILNCYNLSTTSSGSSNVLGSSSLVNGNYIYSSTTTGWKDSDASYILTFISTTILSTINNTWTRLSLSTLSSATIIPYKLNAFNIPIYTKNNITVSSLPYYSENGSILFNSFSIIAVYLTSNGKASKTLPTDITINRKYGIITLSSALGLNNTYIIRILAQNTTYNYYSINSYTVTIPSNVTIITNTSSLVPDDCIVNYKFDTNDLYNTSYVLNNITYYSANVFNYTTETYDASLCNLNTLDTLNYAIGSSSLSVLNTSKQYVYNSNLGFSINSADNLNTNGISISFWVKTRSLNPYNISQSLFYISDTKNYSSGNVIYMRYLYNGTNQGLEIVSGYLSDSSNSIFMINPPALDGAWNHIVFIIPSNNGSQINGASTNSWQLYVDNSAVSLPEFTNGSASYPKNAMYNNLYIGAMPTLVDGSLNNYFNGNIDDFRIYNRVLNSNEITNLYTLEINPPTNYISNGNFASGSANWTLYNGAGLNVFPVFAANISMWIPATSGIVVTNSLYQNITLNSGTYRLTFDMGSTGAGVILFINMGSINIFSVTSSSVIYTYKRYSITFNLISTQSGFMIGTNNNGVYGVGFAVSNFSITPIASQYNVPIYDGFDSSINIVQLPFYSCPAVSIYTNFAINTINNNPPANYPYITINSSNGILQFNTSTITNTNYLVNVNAYNSTNYNYSNTTYTASVSSSPTVYTITSTLPTYDYLTLYCFNKMDFTNNKVINYGSGLYDLNLINSASIDSVNYIVGNGSLSLNKSSTNQYALNNALNLSINASTSTNTQGISICFWQKTKIFTAPQALFFISDVSNSLSVNTINMQYLINGNNGMQITVGHLTDNSNSIFIPNSYTNDGNWHHYALIIPDNSGSIVSGSATSSPWQLYIDNVAYTLPSFTNGSNVYPLDATYNYLYIGAMPDISGNISKNFSGNIDEFYIYNRVLSVIEITNLYTNANNNYNPVQNAPNDFYTYYSLSVQNQYAGNTDLWNFATQTYDASMVNGAIINGVTSGIEYSSLSLNNYSTNYVSTSNQYVYNQNLGLTVDSTTSTNISGLSFSFWAKMNGYASQSFFSMIDVPDISANRNYNMLNMRYIIRQTTPGIEITIGNNYCFISGVTINDSKWHHYVFIIPNNGSSTTNGNNTSSSWILYVDNTAYTPSFISGNSVYPYNSLYKYLTIGANTYTDLINGNPVYVVGDAYKFGAFGSVTNAPLVACIWYGTYTRYNNDDYNGGGYVFQKMFYSDVSYSGIISVISAQGAFVYFNNTTTMVCGNRQSANVIVNKGYNYIYITVYRQNGFSEGGGLLSTLYNSNTSQYTVVSDSSWKTVYTPGQYNVIPTPVISNITDYFVGNMNDFRVYNRTLTRQEVKNLYYVQKYTPTNINNNIPVITGFTDKFNYLKAGSLYNGVVDQNNIFYLVSGYQIYLSSNFQALYGYGGGYNSDLTITTPSNFYDPSYNFLYFRFATGFYDTNLYAYIGKYLYFQNSGNYSISFYLASLNSVPNVTVYLDNSYVILEANSINPIITTSDGTSFTNNPKKLTNLYKYGSLVYYYLTFKFANVAVGNKFMKIKLGLGNGVNYYYPNNYNVNHYITGLTVNNYTDTSANFDLYSVNPIVWMDSLDNSTLFNTITTTDRGSIDMYTYTTTSISSFTSIYGWRNKGWLNNNVTWSSPVTFYNPKLYLNNNPSSSFINLSSVYSIFFVASCNDISGSNYKYNSGLLGNGTTKYVYTLPNTTDISTNLQNTTIYVNGKQTKTVPSITSLQIIEVVSSSPNTLTNVSIGNGDTTNPSWNGKIAEVVMFDVSISSLTRQKVEAYLANKWNLKYSLDSSNSYLNIDTVTPTTYPSLANPTVISNDYKYHVFTSSSTITFTSGGSVEYLIIGGGGAGGSNHGGGGGAGDVIAGTTIINATSYSVVVGSGGSNSTNGGDSSVFGITGIGGGRGGGASSGIASSGGSGGGGSGHVTSGIAGSADSNSNLGNSGGNGNKNPGGGGGGGGAGSAGNATNTDVGGVGGNGTTNYSSWLSVINNSMSSTWQSATNNGQVIASGGSGGSWAQTSVVVGPLGGGGSGGTNNNVTISPTDGVANTGGGGGGGGSGGQTGASGGSGIVIIRYKTSGDFVSMIINTISYIPPIIDTSNTLQYLYEPATHLVLDTTSNDTGFYPSTIYNNNVSFTTIAGKQCAYFNNFVNTYISIPFTPQMNNFSFAFWVYTIDSNYYTCATIANANFDATYNTMNLDINNSISFLTYIAMPTPWTIANTYTINTVQTWTHVGYVVDLNNFRVTIYGNGNQINDLYGSAAFNAYNATQFALGKSGSSLQDGRAFNGYIREFVLYRKLLTASQMLDIYNNTM